MHIVNIMFSRGLGGIEQAFLDYCVALKARGHTVSAVCSPDAAVLGTLAQAGVPVLQLHNYNIWDVIARFRLRRHLKKLKPDAVIGHGMRAYGLGRVATRGWCKMVGITHNYSTKRLVDADAIIAITRPLQQKLRDEGLSSERIFAIPNMAPCGEKLTRQPWRTPPVIGSMGRFVKKKGFDVYIEALALLKARGYSFRAVLGGEGEEGEALKKLAGERGLDDQLEFTGWVKDKAQFFDGIDIFCLPSLHEPFGIVLLEAFAHCVPVVSSDSEGPADIISPDTDALLVAKNDAAAMANALAKLLDSPQLASQLADNAYVKIRDHYAMQPVGAQIEAALLKITG